MNSDPPSHNAGVARVQTHGTEKMFFLRMRVASQLATQLSGGGWPLARGDRAEPLQPSPDGQMRVLGSVVQGRAVTPSTCPLESIIPVGTMNSLDHDALPISSSVG